MSDIPYARLPDEGEMVDLEATLHEGVVGFRPEFIFGDGILQTQYLEEHGHEYWEEPGYYGGYDSYGNERANSRFRSVRIFKIAQGHGVVLHEGERWHGRVDGWSISDRKSKDGRAIIYVTVRDLVRRYSWSVEREGDNLVISMKCGGRALRQRVIPLKKRLYRFCAKGDPTKTIVEIKALGTEHQPVALVDLHFPRRTTLKDLVDAEIAVFERRLQTPAMRRVAGQNVLKTIQVVSREKLEKYWSLPFVGRNDLNSVLGRR